MMEQTDSWSSRSLTERLNYVQTRLHGPLLEQIERASRDLARSPDAATAAVAPLLDTVERHLHQSDGALFALLRAGLVAPAIAGLRSSHASLVGTLDQLRTLANLLPPATADRVRTLSETIRATLAAEVDLLVPAVTLG